WRIASRSAWVASGGSISDTGSPTKLKSEKAMNPTTSMTIMPWRILRRTNAIICSLRLGSGRGSLHGHPLHREEIVRAVHDAHVRAHRPRDHLEVQRDVAEVLHVDLRYLVGDLGALLRIDLGLLP